jgi:hypothetical protein
MVSMVLEEIRDLAAQPPVPRIQMKKPGLEKGRAFLSD